MIQITAAIISLYVAIRCGIMLARTRRGVEEHNFFSRLRTPICDGAEQRGISTLCRDTDDDERLESLLAVEYPAYEVIVVGDSLRSPDSLQRLIAHYRMIAVDGRMSNDRHLPHVRKMYRSTCRCYRRLLLLDVSTTGQRSDLDAAFDVATYDYILPLWNAERLLPRSIERLTAEIHTSSKGSRSSLTSWFGSGITLYPRESFSEIDGIASINIRDRRRHRILYEPLAVGDTSHANRGVVIAIAGGIATIVCTALSLAGIASITTAIAAITLLGIATTAYSAYILTTSYQAVNPACGNPAVGYGETLYLFCKNLLPQIWQNRK